MQVAFKVGSDEVIEINEVKVYQWKSSLSLINIRYFNHVRQTDESLKELNGAPQLCSGSFVGRRGLGSGADPEQRCRLGLEQQDPCL